MREEIAQISQLLREDVLRCWYELHEATTKKDQTFWKRAFTRSVFAYIEGSCEFLRSKAFDVLMNKICEGHLSGKLQIPLGPISVLAGETYYINDEGEIRPQHLRTPFLSNLLFCINSFAEALGTAYRIKKGDGWQRIQPAVRVRDNLMHPKTLESFNITEQELLDVAFTLKWFHQQLYFVLKEVGFKSQKFPEFPDELFKLKLKKLK